MIKELDCDFIKVFCFITRCINDAISISYQNPLILLYIAFWKIPR